MARLKVKRFLLVATCHINGVRCGNLLNYTYVQYKGSGSVIFTRQFLIDSLKQKVIKNNKILRSGSRENWSYILKTNNPIWKFLVEIPGSPYNSPCIFFTIVIFIV